VWLDSGRAFWGDTFILAGSTGFISVAEFVLWLGRTGYTGDVVSADGTGYYARSGYLQRAG